MRIAWATDTHLNFVTDEQVTNFGAELAKFEASIITGDISDLPNLSRHLKILGTYDAPVYVVAGNHDAYGGSIAAMRQVIRNSTASGSVKYLHDLDVVRLTEKTAMVGVDGWYDGRNGDYLRSSVELTDFYAIAEMVGTKSQRLIAMQKFTDESAELLEKKLERAMAIPEVEHVIVATHVPPFPGASWHLGKPSDRNFNPFFSNLSVGEAIVRAAAKGTAEVMVLCGHSHSPGTIKPAKLIECHTGGARYGHPCVFRALEIP